MEQKFYLSKLGLARFVRTALKLKIQILNRIYIIFFEDHARTILVGSTLGNRLANKRFWVDLSVGTMFDLSFRELI